MKIINSNNNEESWEKVYVSEEIKVSLVSKDCLIRLKILDPSLFLSEKAVRSFSVNQIEDNKDSTSNTVVASNSIAKPVNNLVINSNNADMSLSNHHYSFEK